MVIQMTSAVSPAVVPLSSSQTTYKLDPYDVNELLIDAETTDEIFDVIDRYHARFDLVNVTTSLTRLCKSLQNSIKHDLGVYSDWDEKQVKLLKYLYDKIVENCHVLTAKEITQVLVSIPFLHNFEASLLEHLLKRIHEIKDQLEQKDLSLIFKGLNHLNLYPKELIDDLLQLILKKKMPFILQGIKQIVIALAAWKHFDEKVFKYFSKQIMKSLETNRADIIVEIYWSFACFATQNNSDKFSELFQKIEDYFSNNSFKLYLHNCNRLMKGMFWLQHFPRNCLNTIVSIIKTIIVGKSKDFKYTYRDVFEVIKCLSYYLTYWKENNKDGEYLELIVLFEDLLKDICDDCVQSPYKYTASCYCHMSYWMASCNFIYEPFLNLLQSYYCELMGHIWDYDLTTLFGFFNLTGRDCQIIQSILDIYTSNSLRFKTAKAHRYEKYLGYQTNFNSPIVGNRLDVVNQIKCTTIVRLAEHFSCLDIYHRNFFLHMTAIGVQVAKGFREDTFHRFMTALKKLQVYDPQFKDEIRKVKDAYKTGKKASTNENSEINRHEYRPLKLARDKLQFELCRRGIVDRSGKLLIDMKGKRMPKLLESNWSYFMQMLSTPLPNTQISLGAMLLHLHNKFPDGNAFVVISEMLEKIFEQDHFAYHKEVLNHIETGAGELVHDDLDEESWKGPCDVQFISEDTENDCVERIHVQDSISEILGEEASLKFVLPPRDSSTQKIDDLAVISFKNVKFTLSRSHIARNESKCLALSLKGVLHHALQTKTKDQGSLSIQEKFTKLFKNYVSRHGNKKSSRATPYGQAGGNPYQHAVNLLLGIDPLGDISSFDDFGLWLARKAMGKKAASKDDGVQILEYLYTEHKRLSHPPFPDAIAESLIKVFDHHPTGSSFVGIFCVSVMGCIIISQSSQSQIAELVWAKVLKKLGDISNSDIDISFKSLYAALQMHAFICASTYSEELKVGDLPVVMTESPDGQPEYQLRIHEGENTFCIYLPIEKEPVLLQDFTVETFLEFTLPEKMALQSSQMHRHYASLGFDLDKIHDSLIAMLAVKPSFSLFQMLIAIYCLDQRGKYLKNLIYHLPNCLISMQNNEEAEKLISGIEKILELNVGTLDQLLHHKNSHDIFLRLFDVLSKSPDRLTRDLALKVWRNLLAKEKFNLAMSCGLRLLRNLVHVDWSLAFEVYRGLRASRNTQENDISVMRIVLYSNCPANRERYLMEGIQKSAQPSEDVFFAAFECLITSEQFKKIRSLYHSDQFNFTAEQRLEIDLELKLVLSFFTEESVLEAWKECCSSICTGLITPATYTFSTIKHIIRWQNEIASRKESHPQQYAFALLQSRKNIMLSLARAKSVTFDWWFTSEAVDTWMRNYPPQGEEETKIYHGLAIKLMMRIKKFDYNKFFYWLNYVKADLQAFTDWFEKNKTLFISVLEEIRDTPQTPILSTCLWLVEQELVSPSRLSNCVTQCLDEKVTFSAVEQGEALRCLVQIPVFNPELWEKVFVHLNAEEIPHAIVWEALLKAEETSSVKNNFPVLHQCWNKALDYASEISMFTRMRDINSVVFTKPKESRYLKNVVSLYAKLIVTLIGNLKKQPDVSKNNVKLCLSFTGKLAAIIKGQSHVKYPLEVDIQVVELLMKGNYADYFDDMIDCYSNLFNQYIHYECEKLPDLIVDILQALAGSKEDISHHSAFLGDVLEQVKTRTFKPEETLMIIKALLPLSKRYARCELIAIQLFDGLPKDSACDGLDEVRKQIEQRKQSLSYFSRLKLFLKAS